MKWSGMGFSSSQPCVQLTVFIAAFLVTAPLQISAAQKKSFYREPLDAVSQLMSQVKSGAYASHLASAAEDIEVIEKALIQASLPEMQSVLLESILHLTNGARAVGETEGLSDSLGGGEQVLSQNTTSDLCLNHTAATVFGLLKGKSWALQMLDAMGKPSPGIIQGNIMWPGAYKLCLKVRANTSVTTQPLFSGQYCTVNIPVGLGSLIGGFPVQVAIGICAPDTCSSMDLTVLFNSVLSSWNVTQRPAQVICNQPDKDLDTKAIVAIVICSIFLFLMVLGTAMDIIYVQQPKWKLAEQINPPVSDYTSFEERTPLLVNPETCAPPSEPGTCTKMLIAFSVYTNGAKLLSTKQTAGSLDCVHGIRFLSMTWVVMGHSISFPLMSARNTGPFIQDILNRWTYQAIINASVSVDSFFALSGLLVAYLSLKEMKKMSGKINWFLFYFHRFWRLTPVYMLVIMVYVCLSPYWVQGPFSNSAAINDRDSCAWWTNLLYINNLVSKPACLGQSWYLANDMQFYILSPLIFVPFYFSPLWGAISSFVFLLATAITPAVLTMKYHFGPSFFPGLVEGNFTQPDQQEVMADFYIRPYNRMGPYVVGMLAGYFLYRSDGKLHINKLVNLVLWAAATACALAVLYGLTDVFKGHPMTLPVSAFYNAVNRQVWSACVCWVIIACVTGNGGAVNTILSWPALIPLSRLTYSIYLVHLMLLMVYLMNRNTAFYMDDINTVMFFLGILVVSYLAAFITSLAFEAPMMALEKIIFHRHKPKTTIDSRAEQKMGDRVHVIT